MGPGGVMGGNQFQVGNNFEVIDEEIKTHQSVF
jgi:hypothetical protein